MKFPDVEAALLDWLKATFAELGDPAGELDFHVGAEMPGPGLAERLPFVWARRVGGASTRLADYPVVEVDTFGHARQQTYDLAQSIHVALSAAPVLAGGVVIDTIETRVAPVRRPWDNPNVRRWAATYELSVRRR